MKEARKLRVYIACPYTIGDNIINCRNATIAWEVLISCGFAPFNPLVNDFAVKMATSVPPSYDQMLKYDLTWLLACDALLRLPGESAGADKEVKFCKKHGIPVFKSYRKLIEWAKKYSVRRRLTRKKAIL